MIVIEVSPAAIGYSGVLRVGFGSDSKLPSSRLAQVRPQDLRPQDRLIQVELTVKLLDSVRFRHHVNDGIDALGLLVDLVGEPSPTPDIDLVHRAASGRDHLQELLKRRLDSTLLKRGVEDDHHLVTAHTLTLPPLDWRGHGLSVTGGAARPPLRR